MSEDAEHAADRRDTSRGNSISALTGGIRAPIFDDRIARALFLGAICWFALSWRIGFFITDSYAIANTLSNVANGHLHFTEQFQYSLSLGSSQPGLYTVDGLVYGRNYGQVYLSLPLFWLLEGLSIVVDLRIAISGAVSLALLGFAHQVGGELDRRPTALLLGSGVATLVFLANLLWAGPLDPYWTALLALQGTMALAGALLGVLVYRLVRAVADRRVGIAMGAITVLSTPVGFWATIPKRHVMTAALTMSVLYAFYVSRTRTDWTGRWSRAGAYAAAGYAASIHAGEGAVLLAILLPVDLLTAPRNDRRDLGAAATGAIIGLLPFLLTNLLISGNPLLSPRWLEPFDGDSLDSAGMVLPAMVPPAVAAVQVGFSSVQVGFSSVQAGISSGVGSGSVPGVALGVFDLISDGLAAAWSYVTAGLAAVTDLERLYHVFVRSGYIEGVRYEENSHEVVELSLLESMPVAGAALASVVSAAGLRIRSPRSVARNTATRIRTDPRRQTDLLAVALFVGLTLPYLPRLPLYSQITVRYLLPTMPLVLYLVARLPPVRTALSTGFQYAVGAYLVAVTVGGIVLVAVLTWLSVAIGEAMQFHALVNLTLALATALALVVGDRLDRPAIGAVALGVAAGATTMLVGLARIEYFDYGLVLLPLVEWLAGILPVF